VEQQSGGMYKLVGMYKLMKNERKTPHHRWQVTPPPPPLLLLLQEREAGADV